MDEREAIVRWLRHTASAIREDAADGLWDGIEEHAEPDAEWLDYLAQAIERGDHLNQRGEG